HVDATRRGPGQLFGDSVVVVERGVEAEPVRQMLDLRGRAGAADDPPGAEDPGDLAGRAADGSGGGRDEQVLAPLQPRDPHQADVRGQPGAAEYPEIRAQRDARGALDLAHLAGRE